MSNFLSKIVSGRVVAPPRIIVYGGTKVGKTTFAAHAPGAILIPVEDGIGTLEVETTPRPNSWEDLIAILRELEVENHTYKTVILDSLDWVEKLIWKALCEQEGKTDIEAFGYGKGYTKCDVYWVQLFKALDVLRSKGIWPLVLCHEARVNVPDPVLGDYAKIEPKLHKRATALALEWADVLGHLDFKRRAVEKGDRDKRTTLTSMVTNERVLTLADTGAVQAGNRYGLKTLDVPDVSKGNPFQPLRIAIAGALGLLDKKEPAGDGAPKKKGARKKSAAKNDEAEDATQDAGPDEGDGENGAGQ